MNENLLTYKRKYSDRHNFDAMIGFTMQGTTSQTYGFETTHIPNQGLGLSGMDDGLPYNTSASLSDNTLMSMLMRVNYNYRSRYMFTASFRADGSSKFMRDTAGVTSPRRFRLAVSAKNRGCATPNGSTMQNCASASV